MYDDINLWRLKNRTGPGCVWPIEVRELCWMAMDNRSVELGYSEKNISAVRRIRGEPELRKLTLDEANTIREHLGLRIV